MITNKAKFMRALAGAAIISLAGGNFTRAQTPQAPAPAAADPAFEAARRAFEALPEAERRALQEALVWTGDFNGVVGAAFGRATRAAIAAFAKRSALPVDGTLDAKGREALLAAGNIVKARVGFATIRDPRTGAALGLPLKILVKRADTAAGSRWSAADDAVSLETAQSKESDGDLAKLFDKLKDSTPERRVVYKLLRPDFFVVTGETGKNAYYTRMARGVVNGAGFLRGYTLIYPAGAKGNDRVSIAVANAYEPFPAAAAAATAGAAPPRPPVAAPATPPAAQGPRAIVVASSVAVSAERVVTALARCVEPKIGARAARVVKQDEGSGLMLLEAPGLGAKPLIPAPAGPAANASLLVLYQAARVGAASAADAMAAQGEALPPVEPGKPARVLAPLQEQAAGGALFDRNGAFVGIVAARKTPVRVAGIVPQSAWPLVDAPALSAFLAANGMALKPAAEPSAPQSAADIAAATRGALYPVVCAQ